MTPRSPDLSDTLAFPPTPEEKQAGPRLRVALWVGALVLLGVVARPTYYFFKKHRSQSLARNALVFLEKMDLTNAVRYAQAAYLMQPNEPAALRAAARIQTTLGHTNALEFWEALINSGAAEPDDRRRWVDLGIRLGALEKVRPELRNVVDAEPDDHRTLWLLSRFTFAEGKREESIAFGRQALAKEPSNKEYRLFLAANDLDSLDGEVQSRARDTLLELLKDSDAIGLETAVFLAQHNPAADQIPELVSRLEQDPFARTAHRLLALQLSMQLHREKKAELISDAVARYENSPTPDLATFAAFLADQREFATTIQAISRERALAEGPLLMPYLDALGALERWPEVRDILARPELPLPEAFREAFRARTAMKLNDPASSAAAWRRALQAASGNPRELEFLAEYAGRGGEFDQAKRAYRALAATQSDARPIYLKWSRFLQEHGTTAELREILKMMAERWPEELSFQNDVAFLDLLLRQNLEPSLRTAESLVQRNPQLLPFRTTLALARLRANEPAVALEAFGGIDWDWNKALPSNRAIYAAVLAANGKIKEALDQKFSIPLDRLRPEEQELIQEKGKRRNN